MQQQLKTAGEFEERRRGSCRDKLFSGLSGHMVQNDADLFQSSRNQKLDVVYDVSCGDSCRG